MTMFLFFSLFSSEVREKWADWINYIIPGRRKAYFTDRQAQIPKENPYADLRELYSKEEAGGAMFFNPLAEEEGDYEEGKNKGASCDYEEGKGKGASCDTKL